VPFALLAAAIGMVLVVITALLHRQFHMFALVGSLAGLATAFCHRRAAAAPVARR
jgi:hypothetical protein